MPRFKAVDHGLQFLAVDLCLQLHPGSFEYALHHLIEHEIDLSQIEARYKNDVILHRLHKGAARLAHPQGKAGFGERKLGRVVIDRGEPPCLRPSHGETVQRGTPCDTQEIALGGGEPDFCFLGHGAETREKGVHD